MYIYQFLSRVQGEQKDAEFKAREFDSQQLHGKAHEQKIRAQALRDVLEWAGFEDCTIAVKDEPDPNETIEQVKSWELF